jgi:hypothetical protein
MAGSRSLKLSILGDVSNLVDSLKTANKDVDDFGDRIGKAGKAIGAAFAAAAVAAGAYAIKIGIEGVKAAVDDEAAQNKLATTLRNATGATDAQIASTEKYLTTLAIQTTKSDEELRPALERLALSTNNVDEAQKLLEVSTRVSVNSGVELSAVAAAVAKAQDGNTTSLGKLGIGLTATEIKGKSFADILSMINKIYPDLGSNTDTAAFKMAQLKIGFEEAKESIGFALLPTLTSLINFLNMSAIPAVNAFIDGLMGNYGMVDSLNSTEQSAFTVGASINTLSKSIAAMAIVFTSDGSTSLNGFIRILQFLADTANVVVTIIKELVSFIVEMSNQVISFLNLFGAGIQKIKSIQGTAFATAFGTQNFATGGAPGAISGGGGAGGGGTGGGGAGGAGGGGGGGGAGGGGTGGGGAGGAGSTVAAKSLNDLVGKLTGVADDLTELQFMVDTKAISKAAGTKQLNALVKQFDVLSAQADALTGNAGISSSGLSGLKTDTSANVTNIYVTGAIDKEGTARTIYDVMNNSFYRGTGGAGNLVGITP